MEGDQVQSLVFGSRLRVASLRICNAACLILKHCFLNCAGAFPLAVIPTKRSTWRNLLRQCTKRRSKAKSPFPKGESASAQGVPAPCCPIQPRHVRKPGAGTPRRLRRRPPWERGSESCGCESGVSFTAEGDSPTKPLCGFAFGTARNDSIMSDALLQPPTTPLLKGKIN